MDSIDKSTPTYYTISIIDLQTDDSFDMGNQPIRYPTG